MGSDNVDIFRKVVFSLPEWKLSAAWVAVAGAIYGTVVFGALKAFSANLFDVAVLGAPSAVAAAIVFVLPAFLSSEFLSAFLPDYPRRWGYFLAACNQAILFVYSLIFTGANSTAAAWQVFWLGVSTVFLSGLLVLLMTLGYRHAKRIAVSSLVHPVAVVAAFHVAAGDFMSISPEFYLYNSVVVLGAGAMVLLAFGAAEYLLRANVGNVSVLKLVSGLLQKRQEELELGYPTEVDVQHLRVENAGGEADLAAPWLHPGPLEGFGGGRITSDIIKELNADGDGFFLHVPSTHKSDPADPGSSEKVSEALGDPKTYDKASKLVSREYEDVRFYGRRFGDQRIVFMETTEDSCLDDYELSIFREALDLDRTAIVDLHNHEYGGERQEAWYNTETGRRLRENLEDFLEELENESLHSYDAGFCSGTDGTPKFAMVESADGQETVLFGIEGNEATPELLDLREQLFSRFDEVLLFTTDTHRSIHEMSSLRQSDPEKVMETVESAASDVSDASIGFSRSKTEPVRLLREDYSGLVFSVNMLVRLLPLSLLVAYLLLVVWIF